MAFSVLIEPGAAVVGNLHLVTVLGEIEAYEFAYVSVVIDN
jgi:hypothetical protein